MASEKPIQIYCNLCFEVPFILYEFKKQILHINLTCINKHKRTIEIKSFENNEKCKRCGNVLENKAFEYNIELNKYICLNCAKRNIKNISKYNFQKFDLKNDELIKKNIDNLIKRFEDFLTNFKCNLDIPLKKSFHGIFSILLNDICTLRSSNLYHKVLNINISIILNIKWDKLFLTENDFRIILKNNYPYILFNEFFGKDYLYYYKDYSKDIVNTYKILQIYLENNINCISNLRDMLENKLNYIELNGVILFNEFKSYESDIYLLKNITTTTYSNHLLNLRILIQNYFNDKETFPSNFVLKRKLCKLIINSLYSKYYNLLDDIQPNFDSLLYLYKRLLNTYDELKSNKLKEKIEYVLSKLKNILIDKIKVEERQLKDSSYKNIENCKFNEKELDEINEICSKLEKNKTKIEYTKTGYDYIILKFVLNFLIYVKDKSNYIVHIVFESISSYFYFKDIEKTTTLSELLAKVFDKNIIEPKISTKKIIKYFLFEKPNSKKFNEIIDTIEQFLQNDNNYEIPLNIYNEEINYKKKINMITSNMKQYQNNYNKILNEYNNSKNNQLLNKKINKYEDDFIETINDELTKINEKIKYLEENKSKVITKIDNIIKDKIIIEKVNLIIQEIKSKTYENFSFNDLFDEWKKEEMIKIQNYLEGNVLKEVSEHLNTFDFECFTQFLHNFASQNQIIINLYEEEPILNLNLFLYKNQINPRLCKLKFI